MHGMVLAPTGKGKSFLFNLLFPFFFTFRTPVCLFSFLLDIFKNSNLYFFTKGSSIRRDFFQYHPLSMYASECLF